VLSQPAGDAEEKSPGRQDMLRTNVLSKLPALIGAILGSFMPRGPIQAQRVLAGPR
jgi:hypothetical protein